MGALNFIRSFFGGNPREVVKLGKGGAGAVNPPTIAESPSHYIPTFCWKSFLMISHPDGATVNEIVKKTGKSKGTIYQEIALIKKGGYKIVRTYEKPVYRFRIK